MKKKPLTNKNGDVRDLTAADFKRARPLKEAMPKLYKDLMAFQRAAKRGEIVRETTKDGMVVLRPRGRPKSPKSKLKVNKTLRLPADLVAAMEASGRYSARAEQALRTEFLGP